MQMLWCSFTATWLRKSSVPLDMKVVGMKMCFCVLTLAKSFYLHDAEFEAILRTLCEEVTIGIKNVILSTRLYTLKCDGLLGLGINVTEELRVSSVVELYILHLLGFDYIIYTLGI